MIWASKLGYSWKECSAKTGEGVEEVFKLIIKKIVERVSHHMAASYFPRGFQQTFIS
jgi:hypothetical protein